MPEEPNGEPDATPPLRPGTYAIPLPPNVIEEIGRLAASGQQSQSCTEFQHSAVRSNYALNLVNLLREKEHLSDVEEEAYNAALRRLSVFFECNE